MIHHLLGTCPFSGLNNQPLRLIENCEDCHYCKMLFFAGYDKIFHAKTILMHSLISHLLNAIIKTRIKNMLLSYYNDLQKLYLWTA